MLNIVFMGTPDFAKESLKCLYESNYNILGVVTNPDKPKGRGMKMMFSPVKEYALEKKMKPLNQIKPVFELRACSLSGFMPDLVGCTVCGQYEDPGMQFAVQEGMLFCKEHARQASAQLAPVNPAVLKAMRWAVFAPLARLFAFSVLEEDWIVFDHLAESYLGYHLDKRFETLAFYRTMLAE